MMRVRLSELELHDLGEEVWDELAPRAEAAVREGVGMILAQARVNLSRPGSKRTAAPAGTPPEMDEGELRASLEAGKLTRNRHGVRQDYGSDHESAGLHEFGGTVTREGRTRRYPPRSYLRAAEEQVRDAVEKRLEEI
jgi:hypothetical protein